MYFVHPQIKFNNIFKAVSALIKPLHWEKLMERLSVYFPDKQFIFTDMGRSAFKIIIEKFHLQNSEILFPAYICDIFYSIFKQYNIKPIFLDIDLSTFHIKPEEIAKKITPQTRAILICHTYGLPFDVGEIKDRGLLIIEDCAHSFLTDTGNLGHASFFSLYKQFPALRGGMLVCPKDWQIDLPKTHFNFRDFISLLNYFSPFALFFKKFGSKIAPQLPRKEKSLEPAGINRVSLNLFSDFFEDTAKSLANRQKSALFLREELGKIGFKIQESKNNVFCYLSALVPENLIDKRNEIVKRLKQHMVFCTRIWHAPIILNQEVQKEYGLNLAEFPNTRQAAKRIINFPLQNYYTEKDVRKIIDAVKRAVLNL